MNAFTDLYTALDETNKTGEKVDALVRYFRIAPPEDAAWALYFLIGRRPRQAVSTPRLRAWAIEATGLPEWLFGESYDAVGDFAETAALLLPEGIPGGESDEREQPLHTWIEERLLPLRSMDEAAQREAIFAAWRDLPDSRQRFVWHKLITGSFRVGVSQQLVTRALAQVLHVDAAVLAHRLMGAWEPDAAFYARLQTADTQDADVSQPYPFCLAYPLEDDPAVLGEVDEWQAEWKWDGIRSQLIRRAGQVFVWSRGEELVTDRYPELAALGEHLPDGTVIDGEILPWRDGGVLPFAQLQRRIGRKTVGKKLLSDIPVIILAYDLLEYEGRDVRSEPMSWRRAHLETIVNAVTHGDANAPLQLSPLVEAASWAALADAREESRDRNAEGLMLKRRNSPYHVGRQRGDWWKWKIAPYTIDAVLVYAQRGSGKRASLYTDYTFAVWNDGQLVPFTKAYSGLTDAEIRKVDAFIRRNTLEKFGPVRTVKPELVFELAFEGIQQSSRHKSGIAVRFPRILRWRTDKPIAEADSLETIRAMLPDVEPSQKLDDTPAAADV